MAEVVCQPPARTQVASLTIAWVPFGIGTVWKFATLVLSFAGHFWHFVTRKRLVTYTWGLCIVYVPTHRLQRHDRHITGKTVCVPAFRLSRGIVQMGDMGWVPHINLHTVCRRTASPGADSMAAMAATAAASGLRQSVALSNSDFTGSAVRQAACPASVRSTARLTVRAGNEEDLRSIARVLASPGRGLLGMDESSVVCGKKLAAVGLENTEMNRRAYRQMLVTTPGLGQYISGVTLFEESLYQNTIHGKKFVECLAESQIVAGVKVDRGIVPLPGSNGETYCQGLDNLHSRSSQFYRAGARYGKWRSVISIPHGPSGLAVQRTGLDIALFAAISQENGLVPVLEVDILLDGDHSIETTLDVSERVWSEVFYHLARHRVLIEGIVLKASLVAPGIDHGYKAPPEQVADYTMTLLRRVMPQNIPGILFSSGGRSEEEATWNLNALNVRPCPWHLSFSFGRALQNSVMKAWNGKPQNVKAGQEALLNRARINCLAQQGKYTGEGESEDTRRPLYEPRYAL